MKSFLNNLMPKAYKLTAYVFNLEAGSCKLAANSQQGYIALISTIIVTLVLLGLTFTISAAGFFARFDSLNGEYKRVSLGLAESCVNTALLKIGQDPDYLNSTDGGPTEEDIPIDADACKISGIVYTPSSVNTYDSNNKKVATITTQAQYRGAFSNMAISITVQNPSITPPLLTYLTISASVPPGANLSDFHLAYDGNVANSGQLNTVEAKTYNVSHSAPAGYQASPWGPNPDCNNGSITLSVGESKQCYVTFTEVPETAKLTLIANITPAGSTSTLQIKNNSTNQITDVTSGQPLIVPKNVTYTAIASTPSGYLASPWSGACNATTGVTSALSAGQNYTCAINFTLPNTSCAETIMMLDRTGTFFNSGAEDEEEAAARALLGLYETLAQPPKVGVGSFGGLYGGTQAQIPDGSGSQPLSGWMTSSYGNKDPGNDSKGPFYPSANTSPNNQWTNPTNGQLNDLLFTTTQTNGHSQGYGNFGFNTGANTIPANATITGVEVKLGGKVSSLPTQNTNTLFPNDGGTYGTWNGGESDLDETGSPSCSSSDSISSSTTDQRESVLVDLSSIPNGSTVTSVQVLTWDIAPNNTGGTYKTFARVNGTNTDATTNLATTSTSGCTTRNQTIDIPDFVKTSSSSLEVGVVKTSTNTNTVRVGTIRAVITHTPATLNISLSSNNGSSWTSTKPVGFGTSEVQGGLSPLNNNSSDMWGRLWTPSNFNNGSFTLRAQNNLASGTTVSLNFTSVKVYYTVPMTGLYALIDAITANQSSVGTWQNVAINVAAAELNSVRHVAGKEKVIILVSDGIPNGPTTAQINTAATNAKNSGIQIFAMHFGDSSGTANIQQWVSPSTISVSTIAPSPNGAKRAGTTVTITTTAPHQVSVNQRVIISGVSNNTLNGNFAVTNIPSPTTFTYTTSSSGTINSGNGTATPTNLFEAPNAGQMASVFTAIGKQVCPAAAAATQASIQISTTVVNNNGGQAAGSNFQLTISGASASPNTFNGSAPVSVVVTPGVSFSITITGPDDPPGGNYVSDYSGCSANINSVSAGQTSYCTIVMYDTPAPPAPPPPPPPPAPIDIGSWVENPN